MSEREIAQLEHELVLLTRHPSMGAFAGGWDPGSQQLERSAYLLMGRLESAGPQSIGQLAETFRLNASTVNRQTAAMLRAGLVERILDPAGGMARMFRLTPHGRERLDQHRSWSVRGLERVLTDWDPTEISELVRSLSRLNRSIQHRIENSLPDRAGATR
ncbi:DNA-binding transcriptional regulator, MarR family [Parafrankia irregularis]|uniref:DNA-binding transcriptional regulator, MarR family n=1 Tax=Parafrankia irregularis TaxID=795642 RepID=A0A0S4R060_9ACTN|nr:MULTISPECIES: MarR family winged helix-turn-helix transcriptional regulator [Frankiaceae]KPM52911.1 transcriptional regulator [Frankia sp. R43]MBE3204383.1 winged helix-turn-helix transcriptional regulator [Parafrankia sp. CH37]CUU61107.1 DNA-binding transcriptional regulator, MarR family [Parafrankia irregularis]